MKSLPEAINLTKICVLQRTSFAPRLAIYILLIVPNSKPADFGFSITKMPPYVIPGNKSWRHAAESKIWLSSWFWWQTVHHWHSNRFLLPQNLYAMPHLCKPLPECLWLAVSGISLCLSAKAQESWPGCCLISSLIRTPVRCSRRRMEVLCEVTKRCIHVAYSSTACICMVILNKGVQLVSLFGRSKSHRDRPQIQHKLRSHKQIVRLSLPVDCRYKVQLALLIWEQKSGLDITWSQATVSLWAGELTSLLQICSQMYRGTGCSCNTKYFTSFLPLCAWLYIVEVYLVNSSFYWHVLHKSSNPNMQMTDVAITCALSNPISRGEAS